MAVRGGDPDSDGGFEEAEIPTCNDGVNGFTVPISDE
jgi:hypothetical protein